MAPERMDVAIVGGGASGVLVATHLLAGSAKAPRLAIIEARRHIAQGAAYSTPYPEHLLNVIAGRMSAFDDDTGHFVRFLAREAPGWPEREIATHFARRMDFARYLRETFRAQPHADRVLQIADQATHIDPGPVSTIHLASGATIAARTIVLALGNTPRSFPLGGSAIQGQPRVVNAWDYGAVRAIERDADLCIVGSGLSMVDAVVSLAENWHRGRLTVVSRHGLMPLSHAIAGPHEGDVGSLIPLGVRGRLRTLRDWARRQTAEDRPWQWVMDRLREHGVDLWTSLGEAEQRRFLRHAMRYWDIHRHRIAPTVAALIMAWQQRGQLRLLPSHLVEVEVSDRHRVRLRTRKPAMEVDIQVDGLINAVGLESHVDRMRSPLLASLRASGQIRPGPHGIGLDTVEPGALVNGEGQPATNLFTIGSARAGTLWESIAIPELRTQAQRLAEHLRRGRGEPS